jgi:hypothetical protein
MQVPLADSRQAKPVVPRSRWSTISWMLVRETCGRTSPEGRSAPGSRNGSARSTVNQPPRWEMVGSLHPVPLGSSRNQSLAL